ncbi:MAG: hypothetical protein M9952_09135 [Microthrixaceae bacterium]|nr:hypothetical protein [Microthrixaceae bacterium]
MSSDLAESTVSIDPTIFQIDPARLTQAAKTIDADAQPDEAACPVPRALAKAMGASACPFPVGGATTEPVRRSAADTAMRRLLRVHDRPAQVSERAAVAAFQKSMLISAARCTLTYVVFPVLLPMVSFARGLGPVIGILIGTFALCCDVLTVRRFFAIDHKWRWYFTAVATAVMTLLTVLLVEDLINLMS